MFLTQICDISTQTWIKRGTPGKVKKVLNQNCGSSHYYSNWPF